MSHLGGFQGIESLPSAWLPVFTVCLARLSEDPHQLLVWEPCLHGCHRTDKVQACA